MSGHSKWSSIKHKKGAADAKRGQLFTKLARAIQVAARDGGPDPAGNAALATAVQKARDASMPKDNIERAIAKGAGDDADAEAWQTAVYEGYAAGGVAVLVEALTDNRNRTGAEVRHLFGRHGGSLGEPNSVAWNFDKKGVVLVDAEHHDEDELIVAIDAGAEDLARDENVWEVVTGPGDLQAVRAALEEAGVAVQSGDLTMRPQTTVELADSEAGRVLRLVEELEDHDDVAAVHANFDVDAATLERLAPA
jgi:YebC/PmpR family DNA-binding regulatory protein